MNDIIKAKNLLNNNDYTCVFCRADEVLTFSSRGVKPLVELYQSAKSVKDFCAADKVVGKGAAFLYLLLGIKQIYAAVISRSALELLKRNNVYVKYACLTDNIINRKGDGICPFEEAVLNIDDKTQAYNIIIKKLEEYL